MRNLGTLKVLTRVVETSGVISHFAIDESKDRIFFLTSESTVIISSLKGDKVVSTVHSVESVLPEGASVVGIKYLPDQDFLCIALESGDILKFDTQNGQSEVIGSIDSGIRCMSWSPDYEVVVFVTGADTLFVMTQDFDLLSETPLSPEVEATKSESEVAAKTRIKIDSSVASQISWRGDGEYFAVSSNENGRNLFRVWERSVVLHSTSETTQNQGNLISWRPSGELIASTQQLPNKLQIVFYERNGLRHREFPLREKCTVEDIKWNSSSDILSTVIKTEDGIYKVQLWSRSNYHWYMKQEITSKERVVSLLWENESPFDLHIVFANGSYYNYTFAWDTYLMEGNFAENNSTVAVIDGSELNLTPLANCVVPPPMAAAKINLNTIENSAKGGRINHLSFSPSGEILIQTSKGDILFYDRPASVMGKLPNFIAIQANDDPEVDLATVTQIIYTSPTSWFGVQQDANGNRLVSASFEKQDGAVMVNEYSYSGHLDFRVLKISQNKNTGTIFVQSDSGNLFKVNLGDNIAVFRVPGVDFPNPCPNMSVMTMEEEDVVVGLSSRSQLYINSTLISAECNSYGIHSEFFLFTTLSHVLRFVHLNRSLEDNLQILQEKRLYNDTIRELETGARIVAVTPNETRLVLQMPRGNLETIYPRALTVSLLRKLVRDCNYKESFTMMRRHRIDTNLIYDLDPTKFQANLEKFILQVETEDFLNLFITFLVNEDVTKTKFIDPWGSAEEMKKERQSALPMLEVHKGERNKINIICDALYAQFQKMNPNKYLLCILTTLVKHEPPRLEESLGIIEKMSDKEKTSGKNKDEYSAEEALKYLIFLVDVNKLYDVALGMYNFDLVLMVAKYSQKDPKEYLPFLAKLQAQEKSLQRYSIDVYLERYEKALRNLSQGDPAKYFEQCLSLIKSRDLYKVAIEIYKEDKEHLHLIMDAYGEKLKDEKNYVQAGLVWSTCNQLAKAIEAYRRCGHWRKVLYLSQKRGTNAEELLKLSKEVAEELLEQGKYNEAALVYETYCNEPKLAVEALIKAPSYDEAIRMCYKYNLVSFIESDIKPTVEETGVALSDAMVIKTQKFVDHYNRLVELRYEKLTESKEEKEAGGEGPMGDEWSETSSMYSSASESSVRSGTTVASRGSKRGGKKTTKKQRRKKNLSGRKGNPKEQEYLIAELSAAVPSKKMQEDIKDLLRVLVYLDLHDIAKQLQRNFDNLLSIVKGGLDLINTPKIITDEGEQKLVGKRDVKIGDELVIIAPTTTPLVTLEEIEWRIDYV
eukprot:TRINITY_DN6566_c0_g1_i2.p1 TRINITY_DN6566_c0_g1~~TRINITY_DN6566_c0_g1_i2.p1  ORF type:complete len:1271 (+),score=281.73 TRINITY_DN6566_c0_g1_i2:37-3849(+)